MEEQRSAGKVLEGERHEACPGEHGSHPYLNMEDQQGKAEGLRIHVDKRGGPKGAPSSKVIRLGWKGANRMLTELLALYLLKTDPYVKTKCKPSLRRVAESPPASLI
ncbi:hypothetical protein JRQ81_012111 [Phrynocephalus forsythii]|uniref:Uncharacterized protein n=1 Tax=Phrynocephalus forsythii TaxID=171643 RepID=A0A9Q1AQ79_9SAUR|nr:hypothetical protein JRQ81_012111 [Phrynocephalus forsythii]